MVAALVRWQFDLDGNSGMFTNAPAERVIGNVALCAKGATWRSWAGRSSRRSVRRCNWYSNNFDGYYTFGAGMALGPGSKVRLQWRAVAC